jgi:hypothetical protein
VLGSAVLSARRIDAVYVGTWELLALGPITAPTAVLIRPDGYVACVRDLPTAA